MSEREPRVRPPEGFDPHRDVLIDARNLRGLTHPLRLRMLGLLRERGPATASMLAARLGESSAATSYHLRQLAEYGFIVEDAERGRGRERWWRSAHRSSYFNTAAGASEEERLMGDAYLRGVVAAMAARMDRWVDVAPAMPPEWREAGTISDYGMELTPEQAADLIARLDEIGREGRDDAPRHPGARRVSFQFQVLPDAADVLDRGDAGDTDG